MRVYARKALVGGVSVALIALVALALTACAHPRMPLPHSAEVYESALPVTGTFYAGAALADVTPPPGSSTFGHAVDARVANGYWTRLNCRAFVLVSAEPSQAVAIVPCEFAAMSTLLQRSVATLLADVPIPVQRLFITAIHTHAGPAHYFNGSFYGGIASTQVPGFDPKMVEFLASRIAGAVRAAYAQATDAREHRQPAQLRWMHGMAWGLTHNRSLAAFRRNDPQYLPPSDPAHGEPSADLDAASRAIDPNLDIMELSRQPDADETAPIPIGWIAFFGMHPTVLPSTNRYFGSDAFGVACRLAEQELLRQAADRGAVGAAPLVGLVNTNEGDLSPRWSAGTVDETISIGKTLAENILRVWKENDAPVAFEPQPRIATSYLEVDLPGNGFGLDAGHHLCNQAELGLGAIWGASDHHSMLIDARDMTLPDYDLHRWRTCDCQGVKREALGLLQSAMSGAGAFPTRVPLGLAQIGDTSIAFVPAEVTSTVGHRIKERVIAANPAVSHAVVGGLANGYFEYVATPEEYQLQLYEGGSTLYGEYTAPFLAANFENMAQRLNDPRRAPPPGTKPEVAQAFQYETGPKRNRLAQDSPSANPSIGSPIGMCQWPIDPGTQSAPRICFAWLDGAPSTVSSPPNRAVALVATAPHALPIAIHMKMSNWLSTGAPTLKLDPNDPVVLSDSGFDFRTMIHNRSGDQWLWTTLFQPTVEEWQNLITQPSHFYFRVGNRARGQLEVRSFEVSFSGAITNLPPCTPERARFCGMTD